MEFIVMNCSDGQINGTATHQSGDGNHATKTTLDVTNLAILAVSKTQSTTSRSNHDDYWSWTPQGGGGPTVQLNAHGNNQIVLVVTDVLLVVIMSHRDKIASGKLA